jgi:iron complex transport system substrate-binding protein
MRAFFYTSVVKHIACILTTLSLIAIFFSCRQSVGISGGDRYVVLSPEIAEVLSYLGVEDRIVGITMECDYPASLSDKTIVGNFGGVSLEKIVALSPSMVFATSLEQATIATQLSKINIPTTQIYPTNLDDLLQMIRLLGEICGKEGLADSLVIYLRNSFIAFEDFVSTIEKKPRVYIEIYGDPLMTASDDSYLGQLLYYAGGENIFPSLPRDYCRISAEDVVILNPDVIILTYPGISALDVSQRKGWGGINAIRNARIYTIEDVNPDLILRATPRNVVGVQMLQKAIYGQ